MSHDVDVLLAAATQAAEVHIPDGWSQGRATFGGLVAGALVARGLAAIPAEPSTLRSVTTNFVAPVLSGPARLQAEILRQGKSATQLEVRLVQTENGEDALKAVALLTLGAARPSVVEIVQDAAYRAPAFDSVEALPFIEGITPDFIGKVDLRPVTGSYPFSGARDGNLTGYMRFREVTERFGVAHLVTLIDGWPPAPAQMLTKPAPLSTMTWTLELVAPVTSDPETVWWYDVVTDAAHDGYGHTQARIVAPDGTVVAISRQTVAVFG